MSDFFSGKGHVPSVDELLSQGYLSISGQTKCRRCQQRVELTLPLLEAFEDAIREGIADNPTFLPSCPVCNREDSLKPLISTPRTNDWIFLFLSKLLGCVKAEHLRYYCYRRFRIRMGKRKQLLELTHSALSKDLTGKKSK